MSALGSRGEAWFAGQVVLLAGILVGALGPAVGLPAGIRALGALTVLGGLGWCVTGVFWLGGNLTPFPKPISTNSLVTTGPYAWVRHPIYTGLLVGSVGWTVNTGSVLSAIGTVVLFVFLNAKAANEEAWLAEQHPDYGAYCARTKRLIPLVF